MLAPKFRKGTDSNVINLVVKMIVFLNEFMQENSLVFQGNKNEDLSLNTSPLSQESFKRKASVILS